MAHPARRRSLRQETDSMRLYALMWKRDLVITRTSSIRFRKNAMSCNISADVRCRVASISVAVLRFIVTDCL